VTLIPQSEAWRLIGHINPGFGYSWVQTNGAWFLAVPEAPVRDIFWPVFALTLIFGFLALWYVDRLLRRLQAKV
jgi:TRAP-type C4-dicarboxylate transport system permease small subunit